MRKSSVLNFLAVMVLFFSCASLPPTQEEISQIGYGEPLATDYQKTIKAYFDESLFDPYSAVIKIGDPSKGSVRTSLIEGKQIIAGYMVPVDVNAKNRYGAYVGTKRYVFIFRNDNLIKVLTPEDLALTNFNR